MGHLNTETGNYVATAWNTQILPRAKMKYKKGESGNLSGRPRGVPNKVTDEARSIFVDVMEGEVQNIKDSLQLLREESTEKYLKALSSLFPYFMPKQSEANVTLIESNTEPSWFSDVIERTDQKDEFLTNDSTEDLL